MKNAFQNGLSVEMENPRNWERKSVWNSKLWIIVNSHCLGCDMAIRAYEGISEIKETAKQTQLLCCAWATFIPNHVRAAFRNDWCFCIAKTRSLEGLGIWNPHEVNITDTAFADSLLTKSLSQTSHIHFCVSDLI